jgi:hypothetical protein
MTTTNAGTPTPYRAVVSRLTGAITGLKFAYYFVGW